MSTTIITPQSSPLGSKLVEIATLDGTICANVTGGAGTLHLIEIDNTANVGDRIFVKVYDDGAPTVGTSDPEWIFAADAGEIITYAMPTAPAFTNLSVAAVKSGGTPGTADPDNAVNVKMLTS